MFLYTFHTGHITLLKTVYLLSPQKPFCPFILLMVTQFAWPCLLSPFWQIFCHSGPLHSPTSGRPCLPTERTLTVSHFFCQKAKSVPSGLMSPISQPVSPLYCPVSHFGLSSDMKQWRGEQVSDKSWSCLVVLTDNWWRRMSWCPDVHLQRDAHTEISAWPHKWWLTEVFNQGLMGATPESWHGSPVSPHLHIQQVTYFPLISFQFYIVAYGKIILENIHFCIVLPGQLLF